MRDHSGCLMVMYTCLRAFQMVRVVTRRSRVMVTRLETASSERRRSAVEDLFIEHHIGPTDHVAQWDLNVPHAVRHERLNSIVHIIICAIDDNDVHAFSGDADDLCAEAVCCGRIIHLALDGGRNHVLQLIMQAKRVVRYYSIIYPVMQMDGDATKRSFPRVVPREVFHPGGHRNW